MWDYASFPRKVLCACERVMIQWLCPQQQEDISPLPVRISAASTRSIRLQCLNTDLRPTQLVPGHYMEIHAVYVDKQNVNDGEF